MHNSTGASFDISSISTQREHVQRRYILLTQIVDVVGQRCQVVLAIGRRCSRGCVRHHANIDLANLLPVHARQVKRELDASRLERACRLGGHGVGSVGSGCQATILSGDEFGDHVEQAEWNQDPEKVWLVAESIIHWMLGRHEDLLELCLRHSALQLKRELSREANSRRLGENRRFDGFMIEGHDGRHTHTIRERERERERELIVGVELQ